MFFAEVRVCRTLFLYFFLRFSQRKPCKQSGNRFTFEIPKNQKKIFEKSYYTTLKYEVAVILQIVVIVFT